MNPVIRRNTLSNHNTHNAQMFERDQPICTSNNYHLIRTLRVRIKGEVGGGGGGSKKY